MGPGASGGPAIPSGPMTPPDVTVEGLTLRHIGRRQAALRDVSLRWKAGERLLLLGPSGSGKSTLALCLNGIIPHSQEAHWEAGRVLVDGQDTRQAGLAWLVQRVAVLFQDPEAQLVMLEVDDEIAFGLENLGIPRREIRSRIEEACMLVGLDRTGGARRLDHLSGGTKQRVVLASLLAMIAAGGALVLDEPASLLDPQGARQVYRALASLSAGREQSLLLIEHRLDEVSELIDRVIALDATGAVVLDESPSMAFGPHAAQLDALGVWLPDLTELARAIDPTPASLPHNPFEAAALLVDRWPRTSSNPTVRAESAIGVRSGSGVLQAQGVTYSYGRAEAAVMDVSLTMRAGELTAIVGGNGGGKTTLGLLLAGVLRPAAGQVLLDGRDLRDVPEREVRERLGYVFQYPEHQFVASSVLDEVLFGLRLRGVAGMEATRRARRILERFGLEALAAASPYSLSHGQKRRLSVATALVTEPQVVVLDEPTFGQDRHHTRELVAALRELLDAGRVVAIITHDLALAGEYARHIVTMSHGRSIFDGRPRELFERPDVIDAAGLHLPPLMEAIQLARREQSAIPAATSLSEISKHLADARGSK